MDASGAGVGAFNYTQPGVKRRDLIRGLWPLESHSQESASLAPGLQGAHTWDLGKEEIHHQLWRGTEGILRDI